MTSDGFATSLHNGIRSTIAPKAREAVESFKYNSVNKNNQMEPDKPLHHSNMEESGRHYMPVQEKDSSLSGKGHPVLSHKAAVNQEANLVRKIPSGYNENRQNDGADEYEVYVDESTLRTTTFTKVCWQSYWFRYENNHIMVCFLRNQERSTIHRMEENPLARTQFTSRMEYNPRKYTLPSINRLGNHILRKQNPAYTNNTD